MLKPKPILTDRIRNIRQCTFGWIDHNFLHRGFLNQLSQPELLLYYFLITVADKNGISYYDYQRICQFLKLELDDYLNARKSLCARSLIAFREGIFQVLTLPNQNSTTNRSADEPSNLKSDFKAMKEIFKNLNVA